jgi:hypothetical protein
MEKIKKLWTADCVVEGFRYLEQEPLVGSLLPGLYNKSGALDHVGFTSSISREVRPSLTRKLRELIKPPGFTGKAPEGQVDGAASAPPNGSRWVQSQWRKYHSITSPEDAFGTVRNSCGGAPIRNLRTVPSLKYRGRIDPL